MAASSSEDVKIAEKITSLDSLNNFLINQDNSANAFYFSDVPKICKTFPCVLGIDEAGRGPVLGPMVYGTSFCPINELIFLDSLGCDDSKALTELRRDAIFEQICQSSAKIGWGIEVISPNTICNNMLGRHKYSLNQISMDAAIGLIRAAMKNGVNIAQIYVDTVGPPEKYQARLKSLFPQYDITVAKKADSTYPIVSAASICAKVARDHALQVWEFQEGLELTREEFGSGYPGDPLTKKFLVNYCDPVFGFPQLVRFSWSTASNALENAYHVEWEDDEESEEAPKGNMSVTSFFKMTSQKPGLKKKCDFFSRRCLSRVVEL